MKALSTVLLLALLFFAAGCADPLEERSGQEVGNQLQRGVTGGGKLGEIQRPPGDPASQ
jgi:hypothetical protein